MKKLSLIIAIILIICLSGVSIIGCSQEQPVESSSSTTKTTTSTATTNNDSTEKVATTASEDIKPVELNLGIYMGPEFFVNKRVVAPWVDEVESRTEGKIKVNVYPGQALFTAKETYDSVVRGVADIGWTYFGLTPGRFPLTEVLQLPLGIASPGNSLEIYWQLYEEFPEIRNEFNDVKVLWFETHGPGSYLTTTPVYKLEDLKGLKIRTSGAIVNETIKEVGAVPVSMAPPDVYLAMEKGVVDGALMGIDSMTDWKLKEVASYVLDASSYDGLFYCIMNKQTWESLPADLQNILDDISQEKMRTLPGKVWDEKQKESRDICIAEGIEVNNILPEEESLWQEHYENVYQYWLQKSAENNMGDIAQKLLDRTMELSK